MAQKYYEVEVTKEDDTKEKVLFTSVSLEIEKRHVKTGFSPYKKLRKIREIKDVVKWRGY